MEKTKKENLVCKQISLLLFALEAVAALLLSYYCAYWFSLLTRFSEPVIAGLWGAISAAIVLTPWNNLSLKMGWIRFLGSVIGVIIPMICIYIFGYTVFAFGCSVFLTAIICYLIPWRETYHGALITVAVVVVVGKVLESTTPIWFNAVSRLAESIIGIVVTLFVVLCSYGIQRLLGLKQISMNG
jgi:uncharacterized membrane protein YgaE (UPF0421/DUF939 family)